MRYSVYLVKNNNMVVYNDFTDKFLMLDYKFQYFVTTFFLNNMDLIKINPTNEQEYWRNHFVLSEYIRLNDLKPFLETDNLNDLKQIDELFPEYFI